MINQALLWYLLIPLLSGVGLWLALRHRGVSDPWIPSVAVGGFGAVVLVIAFFASQGVATSDVEIWNGQVTAKERLHGSYQRPYDCNCYTTPRVCTGSGNNRSCSGGDRRCQTCYEDRYTVHWNCSTTIGGFTIDSRDRTSRSVYLTPDPQRWSIIQPGDPASKTSMYTNYVQAVPSSLFTPSSADLKARFANLIPKYPDQIYDFYKINRFLTPGYSVPEAALWNNDISMMLRELGPKKQVNAIVVIAKTDDPNYEYALRDAWQGANKNDVVLVIGSKNYPTIDFVRVISWTKNEMFKVELRDNVQELGTIRREAVMGLLQTQIAKNFERRRMREFEYLKAEIDPPTWVLMMIVVLILGAMGGAYAFCTGMFNRPRRFS